MPKSMSWRPRAGWFVAISLIAALPAHACWEQAGQRYGVSPQLLYAIARVESGLDARAVNRSHVQRTGSYDIGLLQINSSNLPSLGRHGIAERDLYDPCTNIQVGAWLLADTFSRHGATWNGVGAYNAACSQLKGAQCVEARSRLSMSTTKMSSCPSRLRSATSTPIEVMRSAGSATGPFFERLRPSSGAPGSMGSATYTLSPSTPESSAGTSRSWRIVVDHR